MPKAAVLVEEVCQIEERNGLFYITVDLGDEKAVYAVRPHTFLAGAKLACGRADDFMRNTAPPLRLAC